MAESTSIRLPNQCSICDVTLLNLQAMQDHYSSITHEEKEAQFKSVFKAKKSPQPQKEESAQSCHCHICNVVFSSTEKIEHLKGFPHKNLSTLRFTLAKDEIHDVFWDVKPDHVSCQLCKSKLMSSETFTAHFGTKAHQTKFETWQKACGKGKAEIYKRFYCKVCNKKLDGTSDADFHYTSKPHQDKKEEKRKEFKKANIERRNLGTNWVRAAQVSKPECQPSTPQFSLPIVPFNLHPVDTTPTIKDQIFHEVEMLLDKLYYSKQVPFEMSLHYLKSVNAQIEEGIRNAGQTGRVTGNPMIRTNSMTNLLFNKHFPNF